MAVDVGNFVERAERLLALVKNLENLPNFLKEIIIECAEIQTKICNLLETEKQLPEDVQKAVENINNGLISHHLSQIVILTPNNNDLKQQIFVLQAKVVQLQKENEESERKLQEKLEFEVEDNFLKIQDLTTQIETLKMAKEELVQKVQLLQARIQQLEQEREVYAKMLDEKLKEERETREKELQQEREAHAKILDKKLKEEKEAHSKELQQEREAREKELQQVKEAHAKMLDEKLKEEKKIRAKELQQERETRAKEFKKEREIRTKELQQEREAREKELQQVKEAHAKMLDEKLKEEREIRTKELQQERETREKELQQERETSKQLAQELRSLMEWAHQAKRQESFLIMRQFLNFAQYRMLLYVFPSNSNIKDLPFLNSLHDDYFSKEEELQRWKTVTAICPWTKDHDATIKKITGTGDRIAHPTNYNEENITLGKIEAIAKELFKGKKPERMCIEKMIKVAQFLGITEVDEY